MRIDRAYKGVSEKELVLFDDGMCDGPELQIGEQYLMYTRRNSDGDVPSRGCTRSRHLSYADEDLKYINGLKDAIPTGTVFGKVVHADYGQEQPASGALVELSSPTRTYVAHADRDGRISFAGVDPGKYIVTASQPGFRMLSGEYDGGSPSVTVAAQGCALIDMALRKKWPGAIKGRVVCPDGALGAPGIDLTLIRMENRRGEERPSFLYTVTTDEQGEYSFPEVAPGRHKIALNLYGFPIPYPTIYWPAARTESAAFVIEIGDAVVGQRYDFTLPSRLKIAVVKGMVLDPDGKPAPGVQVAIDALPGNRNGHGTETDAAGRFSFTALEGFEYSLSAATYGGVWQRSNDVAFSLAKGPDFITLVLKAVEPARIRVSQP